MDERKTNREGLGSAYMGSDRSCENVAKGNTHTQSTTRKYMRPVHAPVEFLSKG